jgi:site-specific recombinase XerD
MQEWSDNKVVQRWHRSHLGTFLTQMFLEETLDNTITEYRRRLHDINRFMHNLNEHIAREANKEDDCRGRLWGGQFKSQE